MARRHCQLPVNTTVLYSNIILQTKYGTTDSNITTRALPTTYYAYVCTHVKPNLHCTMEEEYRVYSALLS